MDNLPRPYWISNEILIRTFTLRGRIKVEEPLRIGAGRAETLTSITDLPVLRVRLGSEEVPVIPGSSWKGIFRSRVESYLKTVGKDVCGGPGDTCMDRRDLKERVEQLQRHPSRENMMKLVRLLNEELCMACKIFGAPSYMSKVYLSDSYPVRDGSYSFSIGRKPGIAIDRRTGAVKRGALYNVEFVEPGSVFSFQLTANNLPNYSLGLLAKVVLDLNNGLLRVGGFKTRGFGRVSLMNLRHEVTGAVGDEGNVLKGFTDQTKPWYDPDDSDVSYNGTTEDLLRGLASLADKWLGM